VLFENEGSPEAVIPKHPGRPKQRSCHTRPATPSAIVDPAKDALFMRGFSPPLTLSDHIAQFEAEPWRTSRELFERLQKERPGVFPDGQLRTLQQRLKG